ATILRPLYSPRHPPPRALPSLPTRRSSDLPLGPIWTHLDRRARPAARQVWAAVGDEFLASTGNRPVPGGITAVCYRQQLLDDPRSEEHTSELQSRSDLVCRLLLEKKKNHST